MLDIMRPLDGEQIGAMMLCTSGVGLDYQEIMLKVCLPHAKASLRSSNALKHDNAYTLILLLQSE